jgi:GAF domain-containing protein
VVVIMVTESLATVAARVVRTAREQFGVQRAALFWRDARADVLTCIATAGEGGADGWVGRTLPAGVGMAGRAVAEGRPVWTADLLAETRVPLAPWLRERLEAEGLHAVAAAPLTAGGPARGALGLLDGAGRAYDEEGLRRLGRFAAEAARDLERALE